MINRRTDYGLRCLLYLAQQPADRWVPTAEVSKKMRVSPVFLAKIFQTLAEAGVIEGLRGKKGGVRLVKREANLAELLKLLEPKFALNKCLSGGYRCFRQADCQLHTLLYKMQQDLLARLTGLTLAGIAN